MKTISSFLIPFLILISTVKIWAQTPELRIPSTHAPSHTAFSKDDKLFASLGEKVLKIWDTEGPYLLKTVAMPGSDTLYNNQLHFIGNEKLLVNQNGKIRFLNLKTFEWDKSVWKIEQPDITGLSNDGKSLYTLYSKGEGKDALQKLNLATGKMTKLLTFDAGGASFTGSIALNSDETMLIGSSILDGGGILVDLKNNKLLHVFKDPQWALFFNEKGNIITSTEVFTGEKDVYAKNKKFKVEELDPLSMKALRSVTVATKSDDIQDYNGIIWVAHNKSDKIVYEINNRFYTVDIKTFTVSKRLEFKPTTESFMAGSPSVSNTGKWVFFSNYMAACQVDNGSKAFRFGLTPYQPFNITDISQGSELKAMVGDKMITFDEKGLRFKPLPEGNDYNYLQRTIYRLVPSTKTVLMTGSVYRNASRDYYPEYYQLKDDTSKIALLKMSKDVSVPIVEMRVYDSLNTALMCGSNSLFIVDTRNFKVKTQLDYKQGYYIAHFNRNDDDYVCALSPDQSKVILHLKDDEAEISEAIFCYDLINKKAIWQYQNDKSQLSNPVYTEGGKRVRIFNAKGEMIVLDASNGKVVSTVKIPNASEISFFSPSQKYVINRLNRDASVFGVTHLEVFDIEKKKLIATLPQQNKPYTSAVLLKNDQYLLTQDEDLKLWETATGKLLARIILFSKSSDWIMITPDGRFDGSSGGLKQMYYVKGTEIIPLEQLYEGFYTPGLTNQILTGVTVEVKKDINNIKSPPSVKLTYAPSKKVKELLLPDQILEVTVDKNKVQVEAEAFTNGDVIEEIRLYHNGKLVGNKTRNLVVEDEKSAVDKKVFDIELVEGENRLKAIAINSQRTESKADEIVLKYKPANGAGSIQVNNITLHLVVVGINAYKNPKYNLNYALADATSFKEAIEKHGNGVFNKINAVLIKDAEANKAGIEAAFEKVKTAANPQDLFVFYYAGHGVVNEKKDFYLVPHDVIQLYGNDDALAQKGLSANQLQQFSKDIKAQKQLFVLDACQSAGALQTVAMRGAAEEKAIAQLARSTGTHWLTASGSEQFASEFTQLGHGTFTYVLLEALSGKADKGGDKKITVKELDAYLQEQVPEVTAKYRGAPQYPASYGFGNDFPIGVLR